MASTPDFVEYVCARAAKAGDVRSRRMFGEYMVYVNDRPVFLVCDNTVYVKKLGCVEQLLSQAPSGVPYEGAKEHYIVDINNEQLVVEAASILARELPLPKPRKRKTGA